MTIRERITNYFKRLVERKIDPALHDPTHFKFNTVARALQDEYGYSKKKAKKEAADLLGFRKQRDELIDKGFTTKEANKLAKKILHTKRAKISDIDKNILTYAKT